MLSLFVTAVALANWGGSRATTQGSKGKKSGEMTIETFAASSPSKEYIYTGGRLIATEECSLSTSSSYRSFPGSSTTGGIQSNNTVSVTTTCDWTAVASSPDNFITITAGSSGSGNGTVTYSVAGNTASGAIPRTGTITISGPTVLIFTVYQGINFLDVALGDPFFEFIGKLSARQVTLGCGVGNYCPNDPVTREQMAVFILRARGEFNPPTPTSQRFLDVPPTSPFYAFIDRMAVLQITLGCGGGNYCPASTVTREQMAVFIIRALGELNPPTPATQRFDDVPPSSPFYNFIDRMAVLGITLGCSASPPLYCPTASVTRGQMAVFLVRAFNL
jgi:hypothetical protein